METLRPRRTDEIDSSVRRRDANPYWLEEATEALEWGQTDRTLDLIEKYAFRDDASLSDKRQAFLLAKQIQDGRWPSDVKVRAERAASKLSRDGDRLGFAKAERRQEVREAQSRARVEARKGKLKAMGLRGRRVEALAQLEGGPYDVVLAGPEDGFDRQAIRAVLEEVGYPSTEIDLLLERVEHIAPEPIAHLLHQSEAVRIKVALEAGGAKVRIDARELRLEEVPVGAEDPEVRHGN